MIIRRLPLVALWIWGCGASMPLQAANWDGYAGVQPRFDSVGAGVIPRGVVPAFVQDRQGFFWIATGDGLVRFDGYQFRPQERPSQSPRQHNLGWIRALLASHDGRVWIGTEADGLAAYDPATDSVQDYGNLTHPVSEKSNAKRSAVPAAIRALAEDAQGRIYMGSVGGGLEVFDPKSNRFVGYHHSDQLGSLPDDRIQALLVDRQQTLWIGSWAGLARRIQGSDQFESIDGTKSALVGHSVQAVFQATDGHIWAGTQDGMLFIVDPSTGQTTKPPAGDQTLERSPVTSFVETSDQTLWVGRSGGIQIFDLPGTTIKQQLQHDVRRPAGLAGDDITQMLLDKAGWVWVSGFGLGLQRHNPNNKSITLREADTDSSSPLYRADVRSLLQLDNGEIWAGTHGGPVAILDSSLRVMGSLTPHGSAVQSMVQMGDGTVWLGSDSRISAYDRQHRPLRQLAHLGGQSRRLFASRDGTLWLGTQDGVFQLAPSGRTLKRLRDAAGNPRGEIHAFAEAPDHSVWIGTTVGLYRVAENSQTIEQVGALAGQTMGSDIVIGLLFDHLGQLWLDTGVAGLHRMKQWGKEGAAFDRISERQGRSGKPFGANLLEDGRGRIWSQMGVYDPAQDHFVALTAADGADLGTGWFFSYTKHSDGSFLFGGSKGILMVRPESFDASTYTPPLMLSGLRINGETRPMVELGRDVSLSPSDRSFSLEFTALDFVDPQRLEYAYRLEPFDSDWTLTTATLRVASYSNLNPGDYRLRIRNTNRSGAWSPVEQAVEIHVAPAWWQQLWMRILFALLVVLLMATIVAFRTRSLRHTQKALEEKVHERTSELEAMTIELRLQQTALEEASVRDPLTGLHNRRYLTQCLDADLAISMRAHEGHLKYGANLNGTQDLLFFMLDIDHFKEVNDSFGHQAGDEVLRQLSGRLKTAFRDTDYLVRWGGEEFLCVARQAERTTAEELAERVRAAVSNETFVLDDASSLSITCSVGFACFPLDDSHPGQLGWADMVHLADAALYTVKRKGRNGWIGVLGSQAMPLEELQNWIKRPLEEWMASGQLQIALSESVRQALENDPNA